MTKVVDISHMVLRSLETAYAAWQCLHINTDQHGVEEAKDSYLRGASTSTGSQQNAVGEIDSAELQLWKDADTGSYPKPGGDFEEVE